MNPMKPETAVPRMDELMVQFKNVLKALQTETVSHKLAELEREGVLVVQELTLVAPRLHEVVIQASRNQRTAIARGLVERPVMVKLERPLTEEEGKKIVESISADKADEPVEKSQEKCEKEAPKQTEKCDGTEVKPVKSKTKKTTKKAKK